MLPTAAIPVIAHNTTVSQNGPVMEINACRTAASFGLSEEDAAVAATIGPEPVIVDELTRDQINWLNAYHAHVYEMLSPRLTEEEKTWLKAKTAPIDR